MSDRLVPTRPRPVAGAPVATVAADAPELAKRWLMALIAAGPLERASRLPIDELVSEAPALCTQALRALASDDELERLAEDGELAALAARAGRLAGAEDAGATVAAVEALRTVLWEALIRELREPSSALVAELASRLAHVCATISATAVKAELSGIRAAEAEQEEGPAGMPSPAPPADQAEAWPADQAEAWPADQAEAWRPIVASVRGEGPAAWIGSIGRRLERFAHDGRPFAVLLVEVVEFERLRQAEADEALAGLVLDVEHALSGELRPADVLSQETAGRYWLVTPDTDREAAQALAQRLARAVEAGTSHRGAPLRLAVGIAVCPEDGREAAALAARADIGVYSARAAGRSVT